MKITMGLGTLFSLAVCIFSNPCLGAGSIKVQVDCSGDDNVKAQAESYLKRELRDLHDVQIVYDEAPDFEISAVVIQTSTQSGIVTGYAVSFVATTQIHTNTLAFLFKPGIPLKGWDGYGLTKIHSLRVGSSLQELCRSDIAQFDSEVLEDQRRWNAQMQEMLEQGKPGSNSVSNANTTINHLK